MTRLEKWAKRVTDGILAAGEGMAWDDQKAFARAVLEREVREFFKDVMHWTHGSDGWNGAREWLDSPTMQSAGTAGAANPCPNHVSRKPGCAMCAHGAAKPPSTVTADAENKPALVCADWCASLEAPSLEASWSFWNEIPGEPGQRWFFCTQKCRDAGRPLHPRDPR